MSSIQQLLLQDESFFKNENPKAFDYWDEVNKQAIRHTRRPVKGDKNPVIEDIRPNESEKVKDYRTKNERQYTRSGFELLVSKSSRAVKQCVQPTTSISETLSEWLNSKPFLYMGEAKGVVEYAIDVLLRKSLENPNELFVAFPYRKENPQLPPNLGDETQSVSIKPMIISYRDIQYLKGDCCSFIGGEVVIKKGDKTESQKFYFSFDTEFWFVHIPYYEVSRNAQNEAKYVLRYESIIWYRHNTQESLVNFLPGEYSNSQDGNVEYLESYIRAYYSYADDAMHAASDDFIVQLRYSYPIPEIRPTKCQAKDCESGFIKKNHQNPCKNCGGSGYILWPGPSGALIAPDNKKSVLDGNTGTDNNPAIKFHSPDLGYAEKSYERRWDLLDRAFRTIGFRVFHGAGAAASAEALKEWKQDELDRLQRIIQGLFHTVDRFLYQCESLLVVNSEARIRPVTIVPDDLNFLSVEQAREEAENALPQEKLFANKNYIKKKYKDEPVLLKANEALLLYTPFILTDNETMKLLIAKDVCTKNDMVKTQYSQIALTFVVSDPINDILDMTFEEIHVKMDEYLISKGLLTIEEENGDKKTLDELIELGEIPSNLDSSEEALTAFINDEITKEQAIRILSKTEKISVEEAIIEIENLRPNATIDDSDV